MYKSKLISCVYVKIQYYSTVHAIGAIGYRNTVRLRARLRASLRPVERRAMETPDVHLQHKFLDKAASVRACACALHYRLRMQV